MTEPNPGEDQGDQGGSGGRRRASAAAEGVGAPAAVEPLTVVEYTHHDPILGREYRDVGVVFQVGDDVLKVVPLAHFSVQVDPADAVPLSADDV